MISASYDIFKRNERGTPVWVDGATDLPAAQARMRELSRKHPGQYLIIHSRTGQIITTGTVVTASENRAIRDEGETLFG